MTYVKIHEDMYLDGFEADEYVNDAVEDGCCFYGNRDFSFEGSDELKSIYDAVNKYVDDETDIEDLEYYFNVGTDKAEKIHRILDMCYHLRQIPESELFLSIAEVVMDKQFYFTTLRGNMQGDWVDCLIPSDIYSKKYKDFLNAVWWGTGVWVEISEDSPYFEDTFWDYVAIPYPTEDEIKKYLEDNYGPVKIVDVDWDYDEDNSPHDADNLYDDTTYDFESVNRRQSVKESLADDYAGKKPIAVLPLNNFGGLEILDILYGIDDSVIVRDQFGEVTECMIEYFDYDLDDEDEADRAYFELYGNKYYLDEFTSYNFESLKRKKSVKESYGDKDIIYQDSYITIKLTGRDYDFIATVENHSYNNLVFMPYACDDNECFEEFTVDGSDWVGILADDNGYAFVDAVEHEHFIYDTAGNLDFESLKRRKPVKEDLDNPVGTDKVKDLYLQKYPDDELGEEINDGVTLDLVWRGMNEGDDFYDIIGVGDSLVRERVFNMLSDYLGIDYDDIYYTWLDPDPDIRAKKKEIRQAYHDKKITIGDYRKQMLRLL